MTHQTHEPGSGRSTSDAALTALKEEIAKRYERAEKEEARKLRAAREQKQGRQRRREGLR